MDNLELLKKILWDKYMSSLGKTVEDEETNEKEFKIRFDHSIGVMNMALRINSFFNLNLDIEKIETMTILHDYAKFMNREDYEEFFKKYPNESFERYLNDNYKVWHALIGGYVVEKELGIDDLDILNAIRYHTTGTNDLNAYGEVLMLSDYTEDTRPDVEPFKTARDILFSSNDPINIKKTIAFIVSKKIKTTLSKERNVVSESYKTLQKYSKYLSDSSLKVIALLETINHNLVKDILVYDVRNKNPLYDFAVVCTAMSLRQKEAIGAYVREDMDVRHIENGSFWTLIDLNDILLHVFLEEERKMYALDRLLGEPIDIYSI